MQTPTVEEKDRGTMNGKPVFNVTAKSVINFKSGFEKKLLCDGLTFSLGDACVYKCAFCYVPSMFTKMPRLMELKAKHNLTHEGMVVRRENALEILKSELVHKNGKPRYLNPNDRRVIYSSPAVDVAGNMTLVRETVAACKLILEHTNWQIRLLSKSNLLHKVAELLCDEVANDIPWPILTKDIKARMIFGVSTGTLHEGIAAAFEQDTPKVSARLKSLHWLQDNGFRTFGMICPSLPLEYGADYYDFAFMARDAIRAEKCEHVWAEVINVRGESMERTVNALFDAGYMEEAARLDEVSKDPVLWRRYNRETYHGHFIALSNMPGKLRYLTYTTKEDEADWKTLAAGGAVLL